MEITGSMKSGRTEQGGLPVYIGSKLLDPKPSQELFNHSPDGFAWGYSGSGPAQLALAILLEVSGKKEIALRNYQDFKSKYVSSFPSEFSITVDEVKKWLEQKLQGGKNGTTTK